MNSEEPRPVPSVIDQLHAVAFDGSVALHGGVVGHAHRLLPARLELLLQRKTVPCGMQIGGGIRDAFLDHAGKPDRDAIESGQRFAQLVQAFEHGPGRGHGRRHHALALADGMALGIDQHRFQARAADIDAHGDGVGGFGRSARAVFGWLDRLVGHQQELY